MGKKSVQSDSATTIVREMVVVYGSKKQKTYPIIQSPSAAHSFLLPLVELEPQEVFIVVPLNSKNEVLGWSVVSRGTASEMIVHPRDVFKFALLANATGIIVAHNHPSGQAIPSEEDYAMTERLKEAAKIIGVKLQDHLIVCQNEYFSFRESGKI